MSTPQIAERDALTIYVHMSQSSKEAFHRYCSQLPEPRPWDSGFAARGLITWDGHLTDIGRDVLQLIEGEQQ